MPSKDQKLRQINVDVLQTQVFRMTAISCSSPSVSELSLYVVSTTVLITFSLKGY